MQHTATSEQYIPAEKALSFNTRFGDVTLREDRLISFPEGILGFSGCKTFGLTKLPNVDESPIMLLQCVDTPEISFLVADPNMLGLQIQKNDLDKALSDLTMPSQETQILSILTMYEQEDSYYLTANLRAPLFIDSTNRTAKQYILSNREYSTQQKL